MADLVTAYVDRLPEVLRATPAVVETVSPLTVAIDGATTPAVSWLPNWAHLATDRVLILRGRGRVEIVGTLAVRPTSATVGSVGSGLVTVTDGDGRTFSLPHVGTAPGIGTTVGISWGADGGFVAGVLSTSPGTAPGTDSPTDPSPPDLPSAIQPGTVTAAATWSATARSGSWRTEGPIATSTRYAMQGHWTSGSTADNSGFWGYGRGLAVAGATSSSGGSIRLTRDSATGMSAAANIYLTLHGAHDKPGTPPALISGPILVGTLRHGQTDTFGLPSGWAQSLLNGTAGGVGLSYAGTPHYAALTGPAVDPSAALISLPYTRAS